jgi:hypothetical protein
MYDSFDATGSDATVLLERPAATPPDLADLIPGPELANVLADLDTSSLTSRDRVIVIAACRAMVSHYQAIFYREIWTLLEEELDEAASIAREIGIPTQLKEAAFFVMTEIGAALHLSNRASQIEVNRAAGLERAPSVFEALLRGSIDLHRADVLIDRTCHLPDADLSWVIDQVVEEAEHLTAGQIRVKVERLCFLANPEEATLRYGEAAKNRMVEVRGNEFGTALLQGHDLPPDRAEAAFRRLTRLARRLKRKGEERTMDQLRADLLLELLLGETQNQASDPKGGSVDLRVDLETLTGLSEAPGELLGFGPVIADIARQVATEQRRCQWTWTVTDPVTGLPIHDGITRRRPRRETRRLVQARNPNCIFPGCRMPSRDCDLDHRLQWSERGPTCECNLVPLCRRHHLCRHRLGWRHRPLRRGDHLWVSPLGYRYTTSGRPP